MSLVVETGAWTESQLGPAVVQHQLQLVLSFEGSASVNLRITYRSVTSLFIPTVPVCCSVNQS